MKQLPQDVNISRRFYLGSYFVNTINRQILCSLGVFTCTLESLGKLSHSKRQEIKSEECLMYVNHHLYFNKNLLFFSYIS